MQKTNTHRPPSRLRCAIYTRKSTEEGLDQEFNSLEAQRESAEDFIKSQRREGWIALPELYDDGGFTGGNMDRPALQRLLQAVEAGAVDCVVVYKVDRLSRSLLDFTRMLSLFEKHQVSFVAVTQQFHTSTSIGRLTLNILLSFAQFEREQVGERTRDKMSAARRKGKWIGGCPVLGYDVAPGGGRLVVNPEEAERVRAISPTYHVLAHAGLADVDAEFEQFAVDAGCAPKGIFAVHSTDQFSYLFGECGTARPAVTNFPGPEQPEALAVPGNDGFRLDDDQGGSPIVPNLA
jgi:site-specific DNA recombinase